jgi:signal transduction histidine kinase
MPLLDRLSSLKLRLGLIIVGGVGTAVGVVTLGRGIQLGWLPSAGFGVVIALGLVQLLARGTTSRIRRLNDAASALAQGDFTQRVAVTSRDEVGALAQSFNQMAEQLAEVDRFRRDLVANASHELRTPIAVLRVVLENLQDGVQPLTSESLEPMLHHVSRLGRLVDQLLDLSRLESGTIPFRSDEVDVSSLLNEAAAQVHVQHPTVNVSVHTNGDHRIRGDRDRLFQVLTNLTDNAVRHIGSDHVLELHSAKTKTHVEVAVVDHGDGIPPEEASRIFDRFYRVDAARSSADGGAGIGLAITRWIVELHGGSIRPEPVEPQGCRMLVSFPHEGARPYPH